MESSVNSSWWQDSSLKPALASSVLCWLAFPPVGWAWLVWLAPIGWLTFVGRDKLPGKHPYRGLWLAGLVFWLLTLHWIRLPHPANYLAWLALSSYLACYLPVFVALSRVGVHRLRLPLWLVAPVVWTGLDLVRAHLFTGFLMGSLAHTQAEFPAVIQFADILGEYGVTFLILLVAASLTTALSCDRSGVRRWLPLLPATILLVSVGVYGYSQSLNTALQQKSPTVLRVALIQGNTLADWKGDTEKQQRIMQEYMNLSLTAIEQARSEGHEVDLVIWPETTFRQTLATVAEGYHPPKERIHDSFLTAAQSDLAEFTNQTGAALLTGIDRTHIFPDDAGQPDFDAFNSAVLVDKQGKLVGTYDKMHRVIFGEFIPFAEWFPALYRFTPLTGGIRAGKQPATFQVGELLLSPNICYETCVPHLIRQHVVQSDRVPDVLVNLTNDAWFWGSSELDMHLACGIFRAVEMRIPLAIAANGGLSAHIDAFGKVQQITPRQQTATLNVGLSERLATGLSFYARWGDWFAGACVLCCMVFVIAGVLPLLH